METLDMFQKAQNLKGRISWREKFTTSQEFQDAIYKYVFFKLEIEEVLWSQVVVKMKNFMRQQFSADSSQLLLLFIVNICIIAIGILFAILFFRKQIKKYQTNRFLVRLIPDQIITRNTKLLSFLCKDTGVPPTMLLYKKHR